MQEAVPSQASQLSELTGNFIEGARKAKVIQMRKYYATNLYAFVTDILYPHDKHKYGPLHVWMCANAGKEKRQLWMLPRGHFKSTILTIGWLTQQIILDPNKSWLILSAKDEHAEAFSDEIKKNFYANDRLKTLFAPWAADRDFDSKGMWTTPAKAFFGGKRREPTIVATGFKSKLASKHYDGGVFDDCIEEDDTSERGIAESLTNYGKAIPLIDPDGTVLMPGTPYHYNDLYAHVKDTGVYTTYTRHALEHVTNMCTIDECARYSQPHKAPDFKNGTPLAPTLYNRAALDIKLREYEMDPKRGASMFYYQYMVLNFAPTDRKFRPEWFVKVDDEMVPGRQEPFPPLNKWIALDSAWKDDEHPSGYDFTVVVVGGFDEHGRLYILDIFRSKDWTMKQGADHMITAMKAYGISRLITEKVGQVTFHTYMKDRCRQAGIPVQLITPKRGGANAKSKMDRIMAAQGYFEQGRVYFRKSVDNFEDCVNEFCNLGRWTNDDIADAISDFFDEQVKVLAPPPEVNKPFVSPFRPMAWESDIARGAFRSGMQQPVFNDPLGRMGTAGNATVRSTIPGIRNNVNDIRWGDGPNERKD